MFKELHPRVPKAPIKSEEQLGRNKPGLAYPENRWVRCSRCNYVLNSARFPKGRGDGITEVDDSSIKDPTVTGGCPLCGSFMYK